jgi:hypothetical protein
MEETIHEGRLNGSCIWEWIQIGYVKPISRRGLRRFSRWEDSGSYLAVDDDDDDDNVTIFFQFNANLHIKVRLYIDINYVVLQHALYCVFILSMYLVKRPVVEMSVPRP